MYTETQLEVIKLFWKNDIHLEDLFILSEDKRETIWIWYWFWWSYITDYMWNWIFPYDPTIPLLEQPEETLKQLISLFK